MAETSALEPDVGHRFVKIDWNPPARQLRQFGWISLAAFPLLVWLFSGRPVVHGWTQPKVVALAAAFAVGSVFAVFGTVRPQWLRPAFVGMMIVGFPIGVVVGEVLFAVVFFVVITPVALYFKLIGRDALERRIDKNAETYWKPRKQPSGPESYLRQS
jgi:multisubunit Na+/H+ antiporter MnhG subunit